MTNIMMTGRLLSKANEEAWTETWGQKSKMPPKLDSIFLF